MILIDVNIYVLAYQADLSAHDAYLAWLESVVNSDQSYGYSELALSALFA